MKKRKIFTLLFANILSGLLIFLGSTSCKSTDNASKDKGKSGTVRKEKTDEMICKYGVPANLDEITIEAPQPTIGNKPDSVIIKESPRPICKYGVPVPPKE